MNSLFDVFTAKSEYDFAFPDRFGRFGSQWASHNIFEPVVSQKLFEDGFRPEWPNKAKYAVALSHDIDILKHSILGRLKYYIKSPWNWHKAITRSDLPSHSIDHLLEIEKEYGVKATYLFLALSRGEQDFDYHVKEVGKLIDELIKSDMEVAYHGGHQAYNDSLKMSDELNALQSVCIDKIIGYRNHYLRFETPNTWNIVEQNGLKYDATFGFSDSVGFRNGMCYPFQPFNLKNDSFMNIMEVPLILMDASLFVNMKLSDDAAWKLCEQIIRKVEEVQGVLTVLWHNRSVAGKKEAFFRKLMGRFKKDGAWVTSYSDILAHWEDQAYSEQMNSRILSMKDE